MICKGITKAGKRCSNTAAEGSEYCPVHDVVRMAEMQAKRKATFASKRESVLVPGFPRTIRTRDDVWRGNAAVACAVAAGTFSGKTAELKILNEALRNLGSILGQKAMQTEELAKRKSGAVLSIEAAIRRAAKGA